jgi:hypothetical protein
MIKQKKKTTNFKRADTSPNLKHNENMQRAMLKKNLTNQLSTIFTNQKRRDQTKHHSDNTLKPPKNHLSKDTDSMNSLPSSQTKPPKHAMKLSQSPKKTRTDSYLPPPDEVDDIYNAATELLWNNLKKSEVKLINPRPESQVRIQNRSTRDNDRLTKLYAKMRSKNIKDSVDKEIDEFEDEKKMIFERREISSVDILATPRRMKTLEEVTDGDGLISDAKRWRIEGI